MGGDVSREDIREELVWTAGEMVLGMLKHSNVDQVLADLAPTWFQWPPAAIVTMRRSFEIARQLPLEFSGGLVLKVLPGAITHLETVAPDLWNVLVTAARSPEKLEKALVLYGYPVVGEALCSLVAAFELALSDEAARGAWEAEAVSRFEAFMQELRERAHTTATEAMRQETEDVYRSVVREVYRSTGIQFDEDPDSSMTYRYQSWR